MAAGIVVGRSKVSASFCFLLGTLAYVRRARAGGLSSVFLASLACASACRVCDDNGLNPFAKPLHPHTMVVQFIRSDLVQKLRKVLNLHLGMPLWKLPVQLGGSACQRRPLPRCADHRQALANGLVHGAVLMRRMWPLAHRGTGLAGWGDPCLLSRTL